MEPLLIGTVGRDDLALVHVLQLQDDPRFRVETVDSRDPRYPRDEKSVIILSTQFGCPVGCLICDAGEAFHGNLTAEQMLAQVRFVLAHRPEILQSQKLKVHFARMGEPALNSAVLEALEHLPRLLPCPNLMPCITSVAPAGSIPFFKALRVLKEQFYRDGCFQLQFSINSTNPAMRQRLIPFPLLDLEAISAMGENFHRPGDRRVVLNFALAQETIVDPVQLRHTFDPAHFIAKLTPVNPTARARQSGLQTLLSAANPRAAAALVAALSQVGFETVVSIGEPDEIQIGSNCGQMVKARSSAKS